MRRSPSVPPREGEMLPNVIFEDRHSLFDGQPNHRADPESKGEGIAFREEDGRTVFKWAVEHLEDTDPSRELRHIADELVAAPNAACSVLVAWTEARNRAIRAAKSFVGLRTEEVEEIGNGSHHFASNALTMWLSVRLR